MLVEVVYCGECKYSDECTNHFTLKRESQGEHIEWVEEYCCLGERKDK